MRRSMLNFRVNSPLIMPTLVAHQEQTMSQKDKVGRTHWSLRGNIFALAFGFCQFSRRSAAKLSTTSGASRFHNTSSKPTLLIRLLDACAYVRRFGDFEKAARLFVSLQHSWPACSQMCSIDSFHVSPTVWLKFERETFRLPVWGGGIIIIIIKRMWFRCHKVKMTAWTPNKR